MTGCIVFWQRMLTPHMTEVAREVARFGVEVHFVVEESLSEERRAMGWTTGKLDGVCTHVVKTPAEVRNLVDLFPAEAVHITQGVRSNGLVAVAQRRIMKLGHRQYPIMEKVDLRGWAGRIKPLVYAVRFWVIARRVEGLLAIGADTAEWIARHAPRELRILPFAYFLKNRHELSAVQKNTVFRFVFVGSLIPRKRMDLLIEALSRFTNQNWTLEIVGDGPEQARLEQQAAAMIPARTTFLGRRSMDEAVARIAAADCLVLPSDQDGWGAVVSEAQINGTPAICSSECGSAGTVRKSGFGAVFTAGDVDDLRNALSAILDQGLLDALRRDTLADWARGLTAEAGARYLLEILEIKGRADHIRPPWERARP